MRLLPEGHGRRAAAATVRELGLAGLVAAVTWGVLRMTFDPAWTIADGTRPAVVWALLAGIVVLGLLRLRLPLTAFVLAAALFGVWPVTGGLLALTAFRVAGRVPVWAAAVLAVLADLPGALLSARYGWSIAVAGHAAALLVGVGLPVGVRTLLGRSDRVVALLRERTHYLEDNYRLAHSAARLQERSRIAQEMHDQIGHRLTLISLHAGALELATTGTAGGEARMIRGTVQDAMQELRSTLGILRTDGPWEAQLQPAELTGTRTDLARLVAESRATGVHVDLTWHGDDLAGVSVAVRRAAHRLVREGLTNLHRHSPGAGARVVVDRDPGRVRIEVVSGPAPAPPPGRGTGLGLIGAQERVRLLGGTFQAGPTGEGGFRMLAELPLATPPGVEPSPAYHPRARRPTRHARDDHRGVAAVLAAGLLGIPALVTVVLNTATVLVPGDTPFRPPVDRVRIGMTRSQVMSFTGGDDPLARMAARTVEAPALARSSCLYSREWTEQHQDLIVRYCFRDDRLSTIDQFPVTG